MNYALKHFITSHESGMIYRPDGKSPPWDWAHSEPSHCTLGIKAVDCFFQPFSVCGHEHHSDAKLYAPIGKDIIDSSYEKWGKSGRDICSTAKAFRASVQWVFAQYAAYMFRMRNLNHSEILNSTLLSEKDKQKFSTMSVHIRGGNRNTSSIVHLDGRLPLLIEHYVNIIDEFAEKMKKQGKPLALVYLASDRASETYISGNYMNANFPRSFKFVGFPHIDLGPDEQETNANMHNKKNAFKREQLTQEIFYDIERLANVDVFLGSSSNFYPVVAGLRIGRNIGLYRDNCIVSLLYQSNSYGKVFCEGTKEVRAIWRGYFRGFEEENPAAFVEYTDITH